MSLETWIKGHQTVGKIMAAAQSVEMISMPFDKATSDLLELANTALKKAAISAWNYAEQCKPADTGVEHGRD